MLKQPVVMESFHSETNYSLRNQKYALEPNNSCSFTKIWFAIYSIVHTSTPPSLLLTPSTDLRKSVIMILELSTRNVLISLNRFVLYLAPVMFPSMRMMGFRLSGMDIKGVIATYTGTRRMDIRGWLT